ncbi:MAG: substrate-binding domain-containing protein, partial [Solirubrobacterales bacterium]
MKSKWWLVVAASGVLAFGVAACGDDDNGDGDGTSASGLSGEIRVDGSSTVGPLTEAIAEEFNADNPDVNVTVGTSGTGGGFEKFCIGETDISNASRPIKDDEEAPICDEAAVKYTQLHVATDALTVVVSADNDFITCLTTDELKKLWEPAAEGKVTTWKQVNPDFPNEKIELY